MRPSRIISILLSSLFLAAASYAEQPPKELIQYIREAQKSGLQESQIRQNAINAGWPAAQVAEVLQSPGQAANPAPSAKSAQPTAAPAGARKPGEMPPAAGDKLNHPQTAPADAEKPPSVNRGVPDDYIIGEGDVLHISVWKEPDASVQSAVVRPDGKISMPMLKEVQVSGLTPSQAEKNITEQLVKFISAADVTVIVSAINSKKIYVVGAVKNEGPIPYTYRMTILQAISEAGGLTDYAKKKKIYVLRHENGRDYRLPFDYDAALRGARMELNVPMLPGDTLVVPK